MTPLLLSLSCGAGLDFFNQQERRAERLSRKFEAVNRIQQIPGLLPLIYPLLLKCYRGCLASAHGCEVMFRAGNRSSATHANVELSEDLQGELSSPEAASRNA